MNILVVDDKKSIRDFVSQLLISLGYTVSVSSNGLDGFEKAQNTTFDLYIVDHLMPLMNGVTLSKNLKKTAFCANTPILFMTTQSRDNVEKLPEFNLFNSIINKPFDQAELLLAIKCLINDIPTSPSKIAF